jgi:hypothetical protein
MLTACDFLSTRSSKTVENPFAYDIDEFKQVDANLIAYTETMQINLQTNATAIAYSKQKLYLLYDSYLQIITTHGQEKERIAIPNKPLSMAIDLDNQIFIGYQNFIALYNPKGAEIKRSVPETDNSKFTSLALSKKHIFVADAGQKQIIVYDMELNPIHSFKGESGVSELHGFILPSAHFYLAVNSEQELWVVNPGVHSIQNYSTDGRLRGYWSKPSYDITGFSGCCNPYYLAFLSDGSMVTSEKGLVRVKIHKPSGELLAVIASPSKFTNGSKAPGIAIDENDNLFLLDFDRKLIRFFEQKKKSINEE